MYDHIPMVMNRTKQKPSKLQMRLFEVFQINGVTYLTRMVQTEIQWTVNNDSTIKEDREKEKK